MKAHVTPKYVHAGLVKLTVHAVADVIRIVSLLFLLETGNNVTKSIQAGANAKDAAALVNGRRAAVENSVLVLRPAGNVTPVFV